jgi:hypothetical protein
MGYEACCICDITVQRCEDYCEGCYKHYCSRCRKSDSHHCDESIEAEIKNKLDKIIYLLEQILSKKLSSNNI